jgi:hypothetical protein
VIAGLNASYTVVRACEAAALGKQFTGARTLIDFGGDRCLVVVDSNGLHTWREVDVGWLHRRRDAVCALELCTEKISVLRQRAFSPKYVGEDALVASAAAIRTLASGDDLRPRLFTTGVQHCPATGITDFGCDVFEDLHWVMPKSGVACRARAPCLLCEPSAAGRVLSHYVDHRCT